MAQSFPVNIAQQTIPNTRSGLISSAQIFKEGWCVELFPFNYTGTVPVGSNFGNIGNVSQFAGTVSHSTGLWLTVSRAIDLLITINMFPSGNPYVTNDEGWIVRINQAGSWVYPMDLWLDNSKEVRITTTEAAGGASVSISAGFINPMRLPFGILNTSATRILYVLGDSISTGKNLPLRQFRTYDFHPYKLEQALNDMLIEAGSLESVRVANKAYGSRDVTNFQKWYMEGQLIIDRGDVILYAFGTNEALNAMAPSTFVSYLQTAYYNLKRIYRTSHIIFVGATPLYDDEDNSNLIALRAAESAWVTSMRATKSDLSYCTLEGIMDETERKTLSNYNLNDGVHPGTFTMIDRMAQALIDHVNDEAYKTDILRALTA